MSSGRLYGTNIIKYILAGKATFTIQNSESGNRFTYKVMAPRNRDDATIRFVQILQGPNNETDYGYIGFIRPNIGFVYGGNKASVSPEARSVKAFQWFWKHISGDLKSVEVFHSGKCGKCGRKLTTPDSISRGLGPVCSSSLM